MKHSLPGDIERTSLAIIARELAARGIEFPPEHQAVVPRVVHAPPDFHHAASLPLPPRAPARRAAALAVRGKGLTDGQCEAAREAVYAPGEAGEDPEREAARALVAGPYRAKLAAGRRDLVAAALARRGFPRRGVRQALDAPDGEEA